MKFVIQHNLMNEDQLHSVADAVKPYPHIFVGLIPFSREITSNESLEGRDFIPYGSTLLTNLTAELGWTGLHFDVSKLNYRNFLTNRDDMLNDNVMSAREAVDYLKQHDLSAEWFTRPSEDLKQYSGQVLPGSEIVPWFESMMGAVGGGSYYMAPETEVVISTPKNISVEWRWFIVGGKIVSGSMYRANNQLRKIRELDQKVIAEAQALADKWLPMDCVVMDTALVDDVVKVVEFNTINSSGFYDNDVDAVFKELWGYHANETN
jgi:hypothetical protein